MRTGFCCGLGWLVSCSLASAQSGPIVEYKFDEGWGQTAWDYAGGGHSGTIHAGSWTESEGLPALRFNGRDTEVDCGSAPDTNPMKAASVECWVYPEGVPAYGEPGVVGKDYGSYLLTYYGDGHFWWYGGGTRCRAPAPANLWHHVVGTFDGRWLRLFIDGRQADAMQAKRAQLLPGKALLLGTSAGNPQFTKGAHFKGMLCEVRVYSRALSADEVARQYRSTRRTGQVALRPQILSFAGTLVAEMSHRGLGLLPQGSTLAVTLRKQGAASVLATRTIAVRPDDDTAEVCFQLGRVEPGTYELSVSALGPDGKRRGRPAVTPIEWPQTPRWKSAPQAKVLNNFVTELLSEKQGPSGGLAAGYSFANPREGWVFLVSTARTGSPGAAIELDGKSLHAHTAGGPRESMRYLRAGAHEIQIKSPGELERLVVRAIPELGYTNYDSSPQVPQFGPFDSGFLAKHVLPNVNLMVSNGLADKADPTRQVMRRWKAEGKRWLVQCSVPGLRTTATPSVEECEKFWSDHPGMADGLSDGLIVDEFGGGEDPRYAAWTEAVRRIADRSSLRGKLFYPYTAPMYGATASRRFIETVFATGGRVAFERYLPEQRSESAARAYLSAMLARPIAEWSQATPGAVGRMIVTIGVFSAPPESLDVNPGVNHKVFLDMQLRLLANDPGCFGLGGVMTYLASYCDEETVRWMGRLFRHYCIDGRADLLSRDPYLLPHLRNGDFADGLSGWTVKAAAPESMAAKPAPGLSWLEGRYPMTRQGDTALSMRRTSRAPNEISQTLRALQPGRLYSLRFFTADGKDLSAKAKHAVAVRLEGAQRLPERSFQNVFANCYSHHWGPYDAKHTAWMNYHWIIFRADAPEATLRISDWLTPKEPGGPAAQELLVNFVQVQPFEP